MHLKQWPGYSRYPFEKRILVKRSAPLTPNLLLVTLAYHIQEFVRRVRVCCLTLKVKFLVIISFLP